MIFDMIFAMEEVKSNKETKWNCTEEENINYVNTLAKSSIFRSFFEVFDEKSSNGIAQKLLKRRNWVLSGGEYGVQQTGFKIHISATPKSATRVLQSIERFLERTNSLESTKKEDREFRRFDLKFEAKVVPNLKEMADVYRQHRKQVGKFFVIYPFLDEDVAKDDAKVKADLERLDQFLKKSEKDPVLGTSTDKTKAFFSNAITTFDILFSLDEHFRKEIDKGELSKDDFVRVIDDFKFGTTGALYVRHGGMAEYDDQETLTSQINHPLYDHKEGPVLEGVVDYKNANIRFGRIMDFICGKMYGRNTVPLHYQFKDDESGEFITEVAFENYLGEYLREIERKEKE